MSQTVDIRELNERIESKSSFVNMITMGMDKVIVGQKHLVESLLIGLLSDGHILLEGVPGLAKTLAIKTLSSLIDAKYSRIQFTPDLLPADVIGTMIYSQKSEEFQVKQGPIFANFVLADEINRAPAKVQSALLEAMQERQVTISEHTYKLPKPFLVMATQNPIEQEGTYPLPEAQVDRFMLKVIINYPKKEEEKLIIRQNISGERPEIKPILTKEEILDARNVVREVYLDEKIERYIVDIVFATRFPAEAGLPNLASMISFGASPRASINLALAARAYAFIKRRGYVIPEDIRAVCHDVMRHRIGLSYEAEANNLTSEEVISEMETSELLKKVRRIEIKTRGLSRNIFAGQYHSAFKGRGMAFSEVREYQYGDDIRDIDWNVTARYVRPYVKVFEEERELTVMLLIDVSGSRDFGSVNVMKKEVITEIAATLAFSAIQNNDKIGVVFFSDKIEKFIPPQKGKKHILYIIRELIDFHPEETRTDISQVLKYLTNAIKKRCTAFLISDFIDKEGFKDALTVANRKHDMVAIQVYDRRETELPAVGLMKIKDAETGKEQWIDSSSARVRAAYKEWWEKRQAKMSDTFKKCRVDSVSVRTEDDYVKALIALFDKRN